jgi:protoporphyrinogen oxidase
LFGLGPFEGVRIIASYLRWHLFPYPEEETFEQWVTNRFGKRLFQTFFKSYTEKVWGISCSELKAEWAAQRIKDLSLKTAITTMFLKPQHTIKTLVEEFDYPRRGPGMMWTAVKERIEARGGIIQLNSNVVGINRDGNRITGVTIDCEGQQETIPGSDFVSSMPVTQFLQWLNPPPPPEVLEAARRLSYRDFLTVCLIVAQKELFPDNWIYIHDPSVRVGRIQNYKNWSPDMLPVQTMTSLGLEYFCNEGDEIWSLTDDDLIELGKQEVHKIGLANYEDIVDGCVFRVEKTYPVYDSDYADCLETIKTYMASLINVQTIGRNGLHRYNNQDHAMLTGMLAVRNMLFGEAHDLWRVNAEQEYHEALPIKEPVTTEEMVGAVQGVLEQVFPKLDALAFGLAVGIVCGLVLLSATLFLVLKGGDVVGPNLALVSQFFPGYTVTAVGSLIGLFYGFLTGFALGWSFAFLRNTTTALYLASITQSAQRSLMRQLFDYI